jgi:FkbM family methyltransferase
MKITRHGFAIIEGDTHIGKWAEESGRLDHDQNALPHILVYIPVGGVVIDIGAYIGDHTIAYSNKVGESGFVMAFEPFKPAFECLEFNLKKHVNTACFNWAIGKKFDLLGIGVDHDNYGMASLKRGGEEDLSRVVPLDAEVENFTKIDLIKIDVEGFEIDVLEGAKDAIRKFKPVLVIEVNDQTLQAQGFTREELFQKLVELGYNFRNIYKEQGLDDSQLDIICFPLS